MLFTLTVGSRLSNITNVSVESAGLLRILASKVSAIRNLSVIFMTKSKEQYISHFYELIKIWSEYYPCPSAAYTAFSQEATCCVVRVGCVE